MKTDSRTRRPSRGRPKTKREQTQRGATYEGQRRERNRNRREPPQRRVAVVGRSEATDGRHDHRAAGASQTNNKHTRTHAQLRNVRRPTRAGGADARRPRRTHDAARSTYHTQNGHTHVLGTARRSQNDTNRSATRRRTRLHAHSPRDECAPSSCAAAQAALIIERRRRPADRALDAAATAAARDTSTGGSRRRRGKKSDGDAMANRTRTRPGRLAQRGKLAEEGSARMNRPSRRSVSLMGRARERTIARSRVPPMTRAAFTEPMEQPAAAQQ